MRHTGPLSGRALVGQPCTPVPGSERRLGAGDREARVCSPEWLRCSRMALGASSPRPGLVALGPLLCPRSACGYQGSQRVSPPPSPAQLLPPDNKGSGCSGVSSGGGAAPSLRQASPGTPRAARICCASWLTTSHFSWRVGAGPGDHTTC